MHVLLIALLILLSLLMDVFIAGIAVSWLRIIAPVFFIVLIWFRDVLHSWLLYGCIILFGILMDTLYGRMIGMTGAVIFITILSVTYMVRLFPQEKQDSTLLWIVFLMSIYGLLSFVLW